MTAGISAPDHSGLFSGLGTFFSVGANHKLEKVCRLLLANLFSCADGLCKGALIQETTAIHVSIGPKGSPSISTQIATLRRLLVHGGDGEQGKVFREAAHVRSVGSYACHGNL